MLKTYPFSKQNNLLKKLVFPSAYSEWKSLDHKIRNAESFIIFKSSNLKFIRSAHNSVFEFKSPRGVKLITRLCLGLSHLREHKVKHSFQDTLNPICSCRFDVESTSQYIFWCLMYNYERHPPEHYEKC